MRTRITLVLLVLISLGVRCGAEAPAPYKVYEIPFTPQHWFFSPFNDGRIWLAGGNHTAHEFDPESGLFTPLTSILGEFATGLDNGVSVDSYDPNLIWIIHPQKGLMAIQKSDRTGMTYPASRFFDRSIPTGIIPEKEGIWIGTSDGLYRLHRSDWKLESIAKTRGIWVNDMRTTGVDEISLSERTARPDDSIWFRYRLNSDDLQRIPRKVLPDSNKEIIRAIGIDLETASFSIADDNNAIWFVDQLGLGRADEKSGRSVYLDLGCSWTGTLRVVLPGKTKVWVLCGNKLLAVDKNPPASIITDAATMRARWQKINELKDGLRTETNVIVLFENAVRLLELIGCTNKGNAQYKDIFYDLMQAMRIHSRDNASLMKKYLTKPSADSSVVPYVLFGLLCASSLSGDSEQALIYYNRLARQYPGSEILQHIPPEDIEVLKTGESELKRIAASQMPPDLLLLEKGKAQKGMMRVSWNSGEEYDMAVPNSSFTQLLQLYPDSSFADNAWWELHLGYNSWDGDPDMEYFKFYIPEYEEFLSRYPKSELAPLVKYSMAWDILKAVEYAEQPDRLKHNELPLEKRRDYLQKARRMCAQAIQAGLPDKDENGQSRELNETLRKIDTLLQKMPK